MKTCGRFRDGTKNRVPANVPPLRDQVRKLETKVHYETWMYRELGSTGTFKWDIIAISPKTGKEAADSIRKQCATWGIPFVPEQWTVVHVEDQRTNTIHNAAALLDLTKT